LSGWSHWGDRAQYVDLLLDDQLFELTVTQQGQGDLLVGYAGGTQRLQLLEQADDHGSQRLRIDLDGQIIVAHVLVETTAVTVFYAGRTLRFELPDYLNSTEAGGAGANYLQAPMPGQVKIIATAVGETVKEGQALMVMEAMKMELTLAAPRDGVVAEITVQAGDQVTDGTVLLMLEDEA
jgi:3-methylcrotonyl-CoA carboxylase alpha subunit